MPIKTVSELFGEAKSKIENLSPEQVAEEIKHPDVRLVDLREPDELKEHGKIEGSIHAVRGLLEFYADPGHSYYLEAFDPQKRIILHCAAGVRSAFAVQTLKTMGYTNIAHLDGGLKAWKEKGLPTVEA